jgi:hypothetical protein
MPSRHRRMDSNDIGLDPIGEADLRWIEGLEDHLAGLALLARESSGRSTSVYRGTASSSFNEDYRSFALIAELDVQIGSRRPSAEP